MGRTTERYRSITPQYQRFPCTACRPSDRVDVPVATGTGEQLDLFLLC